MFPPRFSIPAWAGALLLVVVVTLLGVRLHAKLDVSGSSSPEFWAMQDFRNAVFYPGVAVGEGVNPYDRVLYVKRFPAGRQGFPAYSPLSVLLHAPFGVLPYAASEWTYFVLVVALTLAASVFVLSLVGAPAQFGAIALLTALMLASRPGYMNILNGQITMQLVLGTLIALEYGARRPLLAAVGLALATLKPTYAIPLAIVMLARGQLRAVVVGTIFGTLGALIGAAWIALHTGGLASFCRVLMANVEGSGVTPTAAAMTSWIRVDVASLLARALHWNPGLLGSVAVAVIVLGAASVALYRLRPGFEDDGARGLAGLIASLAVLLALYHQPYDVLLLVLPVVSLLVGEHADWRRLGRGVRWALFALLLIPFVNYVATDTIVGGLTRGQWPWTTIVSINAVALALAFALGLAVAWRRPTGSGAQSIGHEATSNRSASLWSPLSPRR